MTEWRGYVVKSLEVITNELKELNESHKSLKTHVNDELHSMNERLVDIEIQEVVSGAEYSIYKKIAIFILGALGLGLFSLLFEYICRCLGW